MTVEAWKVPALWPGETFVCIASGPSLTQADVDFVRGKARVIVVNDNYKRAPWADVLYFADQRWWEWHRARPEYQAFKGIKITMSEAVLRGEPGVKWLRNIGGTGLSEHRDGLATGSNGGYQAIGLAVHFGAKRIVLLGYDMKLGPKGEQHWFGAHPNYQLTAQNLEVFRDRFGTLLGPLKVKGIEIINASRDTGLVHFPRKPLADSLFNTA